MNREKNIIKEKQSNSKEESLEKLKYYTTLYKFPKYLEKVIIIIINHYINLFSVFFIQI